MKSPESKSSTPAALQHTTESNPFFSKARSGVFDPDYHLKEPFFSGIHPVQAKVKIHPANDTYEQEADATADRIVRHMNTPQHVQREGSGEGGEEVMTMMSGRGITPLQTKPAFESPSAMEQNSSYGLGEEEMPLQRQVEDDTVQTKTDESAGEGDSYLESKLNGSKNQGSTLPDVTRSKMESVFGADFSGVHVHTDNNAAQMNQQLGARAFTHGSDLYFNQGEYQPATSTGDHLLAHELTHTVQQGAASRESPVQKRIQRAPAPTVIAATKSSEVVNISKGSFDPSEKVKGEIEEAENGLDVRVKAGETTEEGTIKIKKDKSDLYDSKTAGFLPVKNPWLQKTPGGVYLHIKIKDSRVTEGYVTIGTKEGSKDGWVKKLKESTDVLVGLGLKIGQVPDPVNEFANGTLRLGANNIKLTIGGFLDASLNLMLENISEPKIEASGKVDVKGVAQGDLKLDNTKGPMTGEVGIAVNFPSFSGEVRVTYKDDGSIDIRGKAGYAGNKLSGSVDLIATDELTAKNFAKEAINAAGGKEKAQEAAPPPAVPTPQEGSKKRALAAVGQLTFNLTDWFAGTVNVVVDGFGQITVIGKIAPPKEIILFQQKDWEKELFKLEAKAYYGIPVVGNLNLFANVSLSALAKLGPAKIYNIEVLGTYSTDPSIQKSIQIAASINISAYAGLRLRAEGGAGVEILSHDLKFGVGLNADAGVKGYADARPTIGYRDPGEFFISGTMEIAAQPVIGLSGELFIQIETPWWSPLSDKKWTWPLFSKEWPIGGTMGFKASVKDYVLGSGTVPEVNIEPVEFDGAKFMSSMVDNNMPDKSGAGKDGGKGKFAEDGSVPVPEIKDPKAKPKDTSAKGAPPGKTPPAGKGEAGKKGEPAKAGDLKAMEAAMKELKKLEGHQPMTRAEITTATENIKKQHNVSVSFQAQGSDIWVVSAGGKGNKQPVKVKAIMKPGDDKDLKGTDKEKEKKLAAGIDAIKSEDKKIAGDGKMDKQEADKVAKNVGGQLSDVFSSIKVIDGGENWNYEYIQKQKGNVTGSKEDKGELPIIGPHPLTGKNRESHHVPAAELSNVMSDFYETIGGKIGENETSKPFASTMTSRAKSIKKQYSGGNNLSAILVHQDTHRTGASAVHSGSIMEDVMKYVEKEAKENKEKRVVVLRKDGSRMIANLQDRHWQAFIRQIYQIEAASEAKAKKDIAKVQDSKDELVITVRGGDNAAIEKIAIEMTNQIETVVNEAGSKAKKKEALDNLNKSHKTKIDSTAISAFNGALDNGLSSIKTALSKSDKDGDKKQHAGILSQLKSLSKSIWESNIVQPL